MPTPKEIRQRITSVRNIAQVTNALEAVSTSKVRRARDQALRTRDYASKAWEVLVMLAAQHNLEQQIAKRIDPADEEDEIAFNYHPEDKARAFVPARRLLAQHDEIKEIAVLMISGEHGLAGSYNANILRKTADFIDAIEYPVRLITVGRKGAEAARRMGWNLVADFGELQLTISTVQPVAHAAIDDFLAGEVDEVFIAFTNFRNMLHQVPVVRRLLPIIPDDEENKILREYITVDPVPPYAGRDFIFEPDPAEILSELVPRFIELQIYQAMLESSASEHAARMVAMRNASKSAEERVEHLQLIYNKARQTAITNELLDIVGGANALESDESRGKNGL
jgi:F-type H+-transporting ATPase subunit gamma